LNQIHCSSPYCIGQTPKVHEADRQNSSRENIWFRLEKDTATSGSVRAPRPHLRQRTPRGSFPGAFIASTHRRSTAFDPRASRNPSGAPHRRAKVHSKPARVREFGRGGNGGRVVPADGGGAKAAVRPEGHQDGTSRREFPSPARPPTRSFLRTRRKGAPPAQPSFLTRQSEKRPERPIARLTAPASTVPLTIHARNSIRHDRDVARAPTATITYSSGAPRSSARTRQPGKVSGVSSQPK
jgi:hypothetical protein